MSGSFERSVLSSDSLDLTRMVISFEIELVDGESNGGVELVDGAESLMSEEVSLEVAPGAFDVVEFWSVFGQPLDGQPGAFGEGCATELAGMDRPVVEDKDDRPCRVARLWSVGAVELLEQCDEIGAALGRAAMDDQPAGGVSSTPSSASLRDCPGAGTRRSAPRLAQA